MNMIKSKIAVAVVSAAILTACGGGGGGSSSSISGGNNKLVLSGIVATGLPLANASVTVKCSGGEQFAGNADGNGRFNISLDKAGLTPCMLRAEKGDLVYFSYAEKDGNVNINPLTDLTISKTLKNKPQDIFNTFGTSVKEIDSREINDATQFVLSAIEVISGYKTINYANDEIPDPFTFKFELGDDRDKLFDALAASRQNSKLSYDDLRDTFIQNAEYREHFAEKIWQEAIQDKIRPEVSSINCNDAKPIKLNSNSILKCVISGKNLAYPSKDQLSSGIVLHYPLGISVSRKSKQQARLDSSELPYNPVLCSQISSNIDNAKSTDSNDPYGPDPTGSFKEELTYSCSSIDTSFEDELEVEVVQYRHPRDSLGREQAGYAWLRYYDVNTNKFLPSEIVNVGECPQGSKILNGVCVVSSTIDQCETLWINQSQELRSIEQKILARDNEQTEHELQNIQNHLWLSQEQIKLLESSECVQSNWSFKNTILGSQLNLYNILIDSCIEGAEGQYAKWTAIQCVAKEPVF